MKPVKDVISNNTYESMQLASQICKVSVAQIKESIEEGKACISKSTKNLFKFVEMPEGTLTETAGPRKRFPFGKYSGKKIKECKDIEYMKWLIKQPYVHATLRRPVKEQIENLESKVRRDIVITKTGREVINSKAMARMASNIVKQLTLEEADEYITDLRSRLEIIHERYKPY